MAAPKDDEVSAAYERWLVAQPESDDHYLLAEPRVRFEPRASDVIVRVPGSPEPTYPGANTERDRRVLGALDGERSWAEACAAAGVSTSDAEPLLRAGFGSVLLAPLAVAALESAIPAAEIVRFPGSPYEIVRSYWANMAAVREKVDASLRRATSPERFLDGIQELHRLLLLGPAKSSFYRPASPISRKGIDPGVLWQARSELVEDADGLRLVRGPRVSAALVGGATYWRLLSESVRDPDALAPERSLSAVTRTLWGWIATARAGNDDRLLPWFCPPRPLGAAHWGDTWGAFRRAAGAVEDGDRATALESLAHFHQRLVRLHPFRAANQSLVMNVVNALLAELGGAGIPHLVLDQLALRFDEPAYARLFARAVTGWTVNGSPLDRYRGLTNKKTRYFSLLAALDASQSLDEARDLVRARPDDAALALLDD
jgi:hypothetical protein